jgi:hypothetical protein
MRTLLLGLLAIATATAGTATALYSTRPPHREVVEPIAVPDIEYRFYDRFCRAQYNNPMDRNACMMQSTGTPLRTIERDDR